MDETWWLDPSHLDDDQKDILLEPPGTEMFIAGPPGSGKTNILVLRANYVRSVAPRLVLLTFTRTLAEFLRSGRNVGRGDQIQRNEIQTFMAFAKKMILDLGGVMPSPTSVFDDDRSAINAALSETISSRRIEGLFDVVFIDEVQSFKKEELEIIRGLAWRINAAGDIRQKFARHNEGIPTTKAMVGKTVELKYHYRIGRKICEFADRILPPQKGETAMIDGAKYNEVERPSSIESVSCLDEDDEFHKCIENIRTQRRYIPDEPIGVLTISGRVRDRFWDLLSQDPELGPLSMVQRPDEYLAFAPEWPIRVMTVVSAQGSEFRTVHLLGAEGYGSDKRELAFTAVTRAKTELHLYHVKPLPGHMIPPSRELPSLGTIF